MMSSAHSLFKLAAMIFIKYRIMILKVCSRKVIICATLHLMKSATTQLLARRVFANNLRRIRLEQTMSQEQLAELSNVHRTYVGSVERGERNVSIDNMERFALALKVQLRDML